MTPSRNDRRILTTPKQNDKGFECLHAEITVFLLPHYSDQRNCKASLDTKGGKTDPTSHGQNDITLKRSVDFGNCVPLIIAKYCHTLSEVNSCQLIAFLFLQSPSTWTSSSVFFGEQESGHYSQSHCSGAFMGGSGRESEYCFHLCGLHTTYSHQHTRLDHSPYFK